MPSREELFYYVKEQVMNVVITSCGADGIRTHDPLVANQVLSQLSYSPVVQTVIAYPRPSCGPEWS
jgi:hypothetical protein